MDAAANGVRVTEPIHIQPTSDGVWAVVDTANRPAEFETRKESALEAFDGI